MTAEDFNAWLKHVGYSDRKAARALGISRSTVKNYRERGGPRYLGLTCSAIAFGLPEWRKST